MSLSSDHHSCTLVKIFVSFRLQLQLWSSHWPFNGFQIRSSFAFASHICRSESRVSLVLISYHLIWITLDLQIFRLMFFNYRLLNRFSYLDPSPISSSPSRSSIRHIFTNIISGENFFSFFVKLNSNVTNRRQVSQLEVKLHSMYFSIK